MYTSVQAAAAAGIEAGSVWVFTLAAAAFFVCFKSIANTHEVELSGVEWTTLRIGATAFANVDFTGGASDCLDTSDAFEEQKKVVG